MITVECTNCHTVFNIFPSDIKKSETFCSKDCWYSFRSRGKQIIKVCMECGGEFTAKLCNVERGYGIFCSQSCSAKHKMKKRWGETHKVSKNCMHCGDTFESWVGDNRKFCSHDCYSKNKIGIVLSKELIEKMNHMKRGIKPKNFGNEFGGTGVNHHNWTQTRTKPLIEKRTLLKTPELSSWCKDGT